VSGVSILAGTISVIEKCCWLQKLDYEYRHQERYGEKVLFLHFTEDREPFNINLIYGQNMFRMTEYSTLKFKGKNKNDGGFEFQKDVLS
jgi:hypothetical protein